MPYQLLACMLACPQNQGAELLSSLVAAVVLLYDGRALVEVHQLPVQQVTVPLLQEHLAHSTHGATLVFGLSIFFRKRRHNGSLRQLAKIHTVFD